MNVWPFKKQRTEEDSSSLLRVLERCRELVANSENSDWSCMDVPDILESLDAGLNAVNAETRPDVDELTLLFLPTGPLQETSMSNGWTGEFLTLSSEFDALIAKW